MFFLRYLKICSCKTVFIFWVNESVGWHTYLFNCQGMLCRNWSMSLASLAGGEEPTSRRRRKEEVKTSALTRRRAGKRARERTTATKSEHQHFIAVEKSPYLARLVNVGTRTLHEPTQRLHALSFKYMVVSALRWSWGYRGKRESTFDPKPFVTVAGATVSTSACCRINLGWLPDVLIALWMIHSDWC